MENQTSEFQNQQNAVKTKATLWIKRTYVVAFNLYTWFWIFRQIFIRQSTDFESYLLWFFSTAGMYFFILRNDDLEIKKKTTYSIQLQ
ncbi:hypothetical protein [Rufibacter sp. LB8]|uniref:hypothetical protein n=1 Tax=Rufibacter sp. LB8 TaxID=2777781 RepID=UPI00178C5239|nr:hypothetical protein [Rufibacter sp. LB8]